MDIFGIRSKRELNRQKLAARRLLTALEKANLELRIFREAAMFRYKAVHERNTVWSSDETLDDLYIRSVALILIAEENARDILGTKPFYNIRALYPPLEADGQTVDDFSISVRRHILES